MDKVELLVYASLIVILLGIGWNANDLYRVINYDREYNGLYIRNQQYIETKKITETYDAYGDWICVNIRDMSYSEALTTCNHEVGHEIFAEQCEKNATKCMEVINK